MIVYQVHQWWYFLKKFENFFNVNFYLFLYSDLILKSFKRLYLGFDMLFFWSISDIEVVIVADENGVDNGDEKESCCICCSVTFIFRLFGTPSVSLLYTAAFSLYFYLLWFFVLYLRLIFYYNLYKLIIFFYHSYLYFHHVHNKEWL
jgi:hypothetical protein